MKRMPLGLSLALALFGAGGCVVHERVVARPPPPCGEAVWVEGHYGPHGHWQPAHWRCAGQPDEYVIVRP
jgi:hypothetical protein